MNQAGRREVVYSYFNNGKQAKEIAGLVKELGISQRTVYRLVSNFEGGGTTSRRKGSGRNKKPQTQRAERLIKQRLDRNPRQSVRKIARDVGVPHTTARRICKKTLHMSARKLQKRQLLTEDNKARRKTLSRNLLRKTANDEIERVLFSDEKNFYLNPPINSQNDRIYVPERDEVDPEQNSVERKKFPQKLMVWGGVAKNHKTKLILLNSNQTMNADTYISTVLKAEVIKDCVDNNLILQQDGAPCHTARKTLKALKEANVQFWAPELWPPNSPDLNPMDYCIWSVLEQLVYKPKPPTDITALKNKLRVAWGQLSFATINKAIGDFKRRLRDCDKKNGGHFE